LASSFLVDKRKSFYRGAEFVKVIRRTNEQRFLCHIFPFLWILKERRF
jgi:hypothetical protein